MARNPLMTAAKTAVLSIPPNRDSGPAAGSAENDRSTRPPSRHLGGSSTKAPVAPALESILNPILPGCFPRSNGGRNEGTAGPVTNFWPPVNQIPYPATARSSASLPDSHSRSQAWGIPINYLSAGQRRRAGTDQDRQTVQRHHSSQPARTHRAQQGTCQLSHRAIYFVEAVRKTPTNFGRTCFLSEKKLQISDRGATMNDLKTQIMAHIDAAAP